MKHTPAAVKFGNNLGMIHLEQSVFQYGKQTMSKTLILFSGGVESTALLATALPEDILVTVKLAYSDYLPSFNTSKIESIAKIYNKTINYSSITVPLTSKHLVHQLWHFVAVAGLWVVKDPSITRVVSGRHLEEPTPENKPLFDRLLSAWAIMHPGIPFEFPNGHLTKQEQWDLIPDNIKPLVSYCPFIYACGVCNKCKEFNRLVTLC